MIEVRRHRADAPWTYADLDRRQRELAERVRAGGEGGILLSEVAPVITLGRRTPASDLPFSPELYSRLGIEVLPVDRGGLATYHGPGQWVLFVVDSLERLTGDPKAVRKAVQGLLEAALEAACPYRPEARIREGAELGVWSSRGKFAAVGVHVQGGVLLHGLSFNGFRTPASFQGLRPCGLDLPVDFLLEEPNARLAFEPGMSTLEDRFERLGRELLHTALRQFYPSFLEPSDRPKPLTLGSFDGISLGTASNP